MLKSAINNFVALVLLIIVVGCKDIASLAFKPYPDVDLSVSVRKVSHHEFEIPGKTTFVHFKYKVIVRSDSPVYFKVENVALSINGTVNNGTYYDTYASVAPHWQRLKIGENVIEAYSSFPGTIDAATLAGIKFVRFGFSRNPEKEG
jgi:hypothetical protein